MVIHRHLIVSAAKEILAVERQHLYGARSGSDTVRRREVERALERVLEKLKKHEEFLQG